MKNSDITDFMDQLYYGGELVFEYDGTKYFLQSSLSSAFLVSVASVQPGVRTAASCH